MRYLSLIFFVILVSGCLCGGEDDDPPQIIDDTTPTFPVIEENVATPETVTTEKSKTILSYESTILSTTTTTLSTSEILHINCGTKFGVDKITCVSDIAKTNSDASICETLSKYNDKQVCMASATGDKTYCDLITSSMDRKELCFYELAKTTGDTVWCKYIKAPALNRNCFKNINSS